MAIKGVVLLSGGLDSSLAVLLAKRAGIDVTGIYFAAPFMKAPSRKDLFELAQRLGISIVIKSIGLDFLDVLKHPEHGYGRNVNPCVDCKIYMFRRAKEFMDACGIDVLITGEVLGQRPMTQLYGRLKLIEKEAGLEGRIIRPLSAKLLEPTSFESPGLIDREKFASIRGRSRRQQFDLASKLGLTTYQTPSGGCQLTNPNFARRMFDLLEHDEKFTFKEINLLKHGRHFRLDSAKLIIGRDQKENEYLYVRRRWAQACLWPVGFGGPLALVFGNLTQKDGLWAARAIARYGKRAHNVKVGFSHLEQKGTIEVENPLGDGELKNRML